MRLLIVFLISIGLQPSIAQDLDIKWSKIETFSDDSPEPETIGYDDDHILILKSDNYEEVKDYWVEIYNRKNLELKLKIKFNSAEFKNLHKNELELVFFKDKKITFFSSQKDEDDGLKLIGTIVNIDGTVEELNKVLASIDKDNKEAGATFSLKTNSSHNRYLITTNLSEGNDNELIEYKITDNNLKILKEKKIQLPYQKELFVPGVTMMDSKGNVYLSGTKYEKKSDIKKGKGTDVFFIYSLETGDFTEIKFPRPYDDMWAFTMNFDVDDNVIIEGRYSNKTVEKGYEEGIFSLLMQGFSGKILKNQSWQITAENLPKGLANFPINSKKNEYYFRDIFDISDDKKMAIMEYGTDITNCASICYNWTTREHMLVFVLSNSGKIESINVVPKNQELKIMTNTMAFFKYKVLTSYSSLFRSDNLYLIYNDHYKNTGKKFPETFKRTKFNTETAVFVAKVGTDGNIKSDLLFKRKDEEGFMITPGNSSQISESEFLVYAIDWDGMRVKFGIMTINK